VTDPTELDVKPDVTLPNFRAIESDLGKALRTKMLQIDGKSVLSILITLRRSRSTNLVPIAPYSPALLHVLGLPDPLRDGFGKGDLWITVPHILQSRDQQYITRKRAGG